ncbi:MAG: AAA family ATPase [Pseudobutyrivibrio ruminis]|uniref:RNA-binding domain-containing protein n=1 Tax=Succinivibrio dextrinosolvens TaxID=83771 RepID=UPI00241E223D|nr:RNA-binding domain-containing protein [Succinivibrio dextrinosolvens]MBE5918187.1 AAA family ATPase [Pseudobutyrivibrio ruminis]MBE6423642.1 AAA family ATPase [Succinivibrio dextrinosolvens]
MIPGKESLTVEFKSDKKKYPDSLIFEEIVALANTEGGDLYLGVEDNGEISGVHDDHKNPLTLPAYIANHTVPPISVRCEILPTQPAVLKLSVPKSLNSIVATVSGKVLHRRLKSNGEPESVVMYPSEFATRLSNLRLLDYSAMVLDQADMSVLDDAELLRLRNVISLYHGENVLASLTKDDLCKALGLAREINSVLYPTVAGVLVLGNENAISQYIPTAKTSFQLLSGTNVVINREINKSIVSSIDELFEIINANIHEKEFSIGPYRVSVPDYDKSAVREAVVNAFCHRDYSKMGRIRIELSDEGLRISSPGSFIDGVNFKNLITVEPHGRNPLLADVLKRIGLAERTGRGIDRIYEGSLKYGKSLPDYSQSTDMNVCVYFPKSAPDGVFLEQLIRIQSTNGQGLSLSSMFILYELRLKGDLSFDQLEESICIPGAMLKTALDSLMSKKIIQKYGNERKQKYHLNISDKEDDAVSDNIKITKISKKEQKNKVISLASKQNTITTSDVSDYLFVDTNRAYKILSELVSDNYLIRNYKGRYTTYSLNKRKSDK